MLYIVITLDYWCWFFNLIHKLNTFSVSSLLLFVRLRFLSNCSLIYALSDNKFWFAITLSFDIHLRFNTKSVAFLFGDIDSILDFFFSFLYDFISSPSRPFKLWINTFHLSLINIFSFVFASLRLFGEFTIASSLLSYDSLFSQVFLILFLVIFYNEIHKMVCISKFLSKI